MSLYEKIMNEYSDLFSKEAVIQIKKAFKGFEEYANNKYVVMSLLGPFLLKMKDPERVARINLLVFFDEAKDKESVFARKVDPLESKENRMFYFFTEGIGNSNCEMFRMIFKWYCLGETNVRIRKEIDYLQSEENALLLLDDLNEFLLKDSKEEWEKAIAEIMEYENPKDGFWVG